MITISDDGKGIDIDNIRQKLKNKGILRKIDQMQNEEIVKQILSNEFLGSEQINDLSGRKEGIYVLNK